MASLRVASSAFVEGLDLVERGDLGLVAEQDVDLVADQVAELVAIAVDAERVRQRDRDQPAGGMRRIEGLQHRLLGLRRVPQIAFDVGDLRGAHDARCRCRRAEAGAGAEIGVHGALRVGRHQDQAARGRRAAGRAAASRTTRRSTSGRGRTRRRAGRRAPCRYRRPCRRTRRRPPWCCRTSRPTPRCPAPSRRRASRRAPRRSASCCPWSARAWPRKASSARVMTSTMALPIPSTSKAADVMSLPMIYMKPDACRAWSLPARSRCRPP